MTENNLESDTKHTLTDSPNTQKKYISSILKIYIHNNFILVSGSNPKKPSKPNSNRYSPKTWHAVSNSHSCDAAFSPSHRTQNAGKSARFSGKLWKYCPKNSATKKSVSRFCYHCPKRKTELHLVPIDFWPTRPFAYFFVTRVGAWNLGVNGL